MKSFKGLNGTIILRDSGVAIVRKYVRNYFSQWRRGRNTVFQCQ